MPISTAQIETFIQAAHAVILENEAEVTELDQAIGDGDHVTNLKRGLAALEGAASELGQKDWSAALQKIGMSLMSTIGGASGSLYGTFFIAMSKAMKDKDMNLGSLAEAFGQGIEAMKHRGRSDLGEKTMLDVLIPVATALRDAASEDLELPQVLATINRVAEEGCESTRDMVPTKGRASFLGERARGHLDAGARTAQLMLRAIGDALLRGAR